jgi:phage tail-like protein
LVEFPTNAHRRNPYLNSKFVLYMDGIPVAGLSKMSSLKRTIPTIIKHRSGSDPSTTRLSPGSTVEYSPITLERGVSHDPAFENWANKVWRYGANPGSEASLKDFRKDLIINLLNEAGQVVIAYKLYRCWVSEYQALPDLDANGSAVAIQTITIQVEAWERDETVPEPVEPVL